jgi:hypothetical protein
MTITGYTISELIKKTGKSRSAVESFISRHEVEPIIGELLYPPKTLDLLINAKRGRPAKNPPNTQKPQKSSIRKSVQ